MLNNQKEIILLKDLGMRFATQTSKRKSRYGLYLCTCGKEFETNTTDVNRGKIKTCGCSKGINHKLSKHRVYNIWYQMMNRCNNPLNKRYCDWGGRGITVCQEWLNVENFINDMYPTFVDGLTLDRINPNGNYCKDNCRWTNMTVQNRNTKLIRKNNTSGYRGVTLRKDSNKWRACIRINNKTISLGSFTNPLEAAKAYDQYIDDNKLEHTKNF